MHSALFLEEEFKAGFELPFSHAIETVNQE